MPNRLLREAILDSDKVAALNWAEEVFYRRLMSVVDDYGRFDARPEFLKSKLYPVQASKVNTSDVAKWRQATVEAGLVRVYCHGGKEYLEILNFGQRIQSVSKWPPPPDDVPRGTGGSRKVTMDHGGTPEETGLNGKQRRVTAVVGDGDVVEKSPLPGTATPSVQEGRGRLS